MFSSPNLHSDATPLVECHALLAPICDAWLQIKNQVQLAT